MAVVDLNDFLNTQYEQLGIQPGQRLSALKKNKRLEEIFYEKQKQVELEGEDSWFKSYVVEPVTTVLNALSAGEYAVASSIRAVMDREKYGSQEDPFEAFFRGFAAGFNDDEKYQTRVFDLLTEAGWNPDTTPGHVAKFITGLAGGILLDPLTWTGYGPLAKSSRVLPKRVKDFLSGLEETDKIKNVPVVGKWINKLLAGPYLHPKTGKPVVEAIEALHREAITGGAEGILKPIVAAQARERAAQDLLRLAAPFDTTVEEIIEKGLKTVTIGEKQVDLVEVALKALGKPVNDKNYREFITSGWEKLFDKGGFKLGIPFTRQQIRIGPEFGVTTPRLATLHGILFGGKLRTNGTLVEKATSAVTETAAWNNLVRTPLKHVSETAARWFKRNANMRPIEISAIRQFFGQIMDQPKALAGSKSYELATLVEDGVSRLMTRKERRLMQELLLDWSNKFVDEFDGDGFAEWLKSGVLKNDDAFKRTLKELGIHPSDNLVEQLGEAGENILNSFRQAFEEYGGVHALDGYFPVVAGEKAKRIAKKRGFDSVLNMQNELVRTSKGMRYHEFFEKELGWDKDMIAIRPATDLMASIHQRWYTAYRNKALGDFADQVIPLIGRSAGWSGGEFAQNTDKFFRELLLDKRNRENFGLELFAATATDKSTYHGIARGTGDISGEKLVGWDAYSNALNRVTTREDALDIMKKFTTESPPTSGQIDEIMKAWHSRANELKNSGIDDLRNVGLEMRNLATDFSADLQARTLDARLGELAKEVSAQGTRAGFAQRELAALVKDLNDSPVTDRALPNLMKFFGLSDDPLKLKPVEIARMRKTLSAKASRRIQDLLKKPEDTFRPATVLKGLTVELKEFGRRVPVENFGISDSTFKQIARYVDPVEMVKESPAGLRFIDNLTGPLKRFLTGVTFGGLPRPAFFGRNAMDLYFRRLTGFGALAGTPLPKYYQAYRVLRGADDSVVLNGFRYTFKELRDDLQQSGLWHYDWSKKLGRGGERKLLDWLGARNVAEFRDKVNRKLPYLNPEVLGSGMENVGIIEAYMGQLGRGVGKADALDNIAKYLFDYTNLTTFERNLSSFFLFYNFQRQAMPFVLDFVKKHPITLSGMARIRDLAFDNKTEEALAPEWVKQFPFLRLDRSKDRLRFMSMRNIFTFDVLSEGLPEDPREFVSRLNPILLWPIEKAAGREIFLERDIKDRKYLRREYSEFALKAVNAVYGLGLQEVKLKDFGTKERKPYWAVDGHKWYNMRRLWFSRMFRDLDDLSKMFEGKSSIVESIFNLGFGMKVIEYDFEKQREALRMQARRAKTEFQSAVAKGDEVQIKRIIESLQR